MDSVESAVNAERGGASRLELCACLAGGGITPSLGLLRVVKQEVNIPVFVMIRPREGDFVYSEQEFEVMKEDLQLFKKDGNVDGFAFGILTPEGQVDRQRCSELMHLAGPLPVTFHRAFDVTKDPFRALETIISLKMDRILTSGQDSSALDGVPLIKELVDRSCGRILIVPGGGITERNLSRILGDTGCVEFHCSARTNTQPVMRYCNHNVAMGAKYGPSEFTTKVTSVERVQALLSIARSVWSH